MFLIGLICLLPAKLVIKNSFIIYKMNKKISDVNFGIKEKAKRLITSHLAFLRVTPVGSDS
jgi:hypothetical protein